MTASTRPAAPKTFVLLAGDMSQRGAAPLSPPPRNSSATGATYGSSCARRASSRQLWAARPVLASPTLTYAGAGVASRPLTPGMPGPKYRGMSGSRPTRTRHGARVGLERGQRLLFGGGGRVELSVRAALGHVVGGRAAVGVGEHRAAARGQGDGRLEAVAGEAPLPGVRHGVELPAFARR